MAMTDRASVLTDLVHWSRDLATLRNELSAFPWDSDMEVVVLQPDDIAAALYRYLKGQVSNADVEMWTNLVESREDICIESPVAERASKPASIRGAHNRTRKGMAPAA